MQYANRLPTQYIAAESTKGCGHHCADENSSHRMVGSDSIHRANDSERSQGYCVSPLHWARVVICAHLHKTGKRHELTSKAIYRYVTENLCSTCHHYMWAARVRMCTCIIEEGTYVGQRKNADRLAATLMSKYSHSSIQNGGRFSMMESRMVPPPKAVMDPTINAPRRSMSATRDYASIINTNE